MHTKEELHSTALDRIPMDFIFIFVACSLLTTLGLICCVGADAEGAAERQSSILDDVQKRSLEFLKQFLHFGVVKNTHVLRRGAIQRT